MNRYDFKALLALVLILASSSACLKTRTQLRSESEEAAAEKERSAQVEQTNQEGRYAVDELKGEVARMTGRIEDLERAGKDNKFDLNQEESFRKLTERVQELERTQIAVLEAVKKLQGTATAENPALFEDAKKQYESGDCEAAIVTLDRYLSSKDPSRAEDGFYIRAECNFQLKQYKKAIVDYSKFPEKYSQSRYMSASLYKIGLSFEAMGMKDDAKSFFQELVEKFPRSTEAKRAKLKLR